MHFPFQYDALDQLTRVVDPKGLATDYAYSTLGDLLQLDSPDTGLTSYTYDSAGNRIGQVDARGQATHYGYDALNRLTTIQYPGAVDLDVSYVYDLAQPACQAGETYAVGRLSAIADASGSTQYCYDRFGDLVRKVQVTNGQTFSLGYAYTAGGRLRALTYPDGTVADYVRDAQGRITEIGVTAPGATREVLLTGTTYAPFGPATGWTYGNGRTLLRPHDLDYRPQAIHDPATGGLDLGYGYDPVGQLTTLHTADLAQPPRARFDHDALGRLTAFRDGAANTAIETYAYDATGNRTGFANAAGPQAYAYPADSHRLTAVAGQARTYDQVGNTLTDGSGRSYAYSAANRLARVDQGGAARRHYVYNGKGERVRSHLGSDDLATVYDEAGRWLGDYAPDGTPRQQAIWLDDLPVGLLAPVASSTNEPPVSEPIPEPHPGPGLPVDPTPEPVPYGGSWQTASDTPAQRLHYVQPDHLGTPRAVIDPVRNVAIWTWDLASEAFGNSPPNADPDGDGTAFVLDLRFPGQRYDAASGLHYNYFRDYDPGVGRYAQSDPIGLAAGLSTYQYSTSNPISYVDPLGLYTYVIITYDYNFGSHAGLFIDSHHGSAPFLYDPSGSYMSSTRGSGGIFVGAEYGAVMQDYVAYHRGEGSRVELIRINTTEREEDELKERAELQGDHRGFFCAASVSNVTHGLCGVIRGTFFPGRLASMARAARDARNSGSCPYIAED